MNFRTIENLNSIIYENLHTIPKDVDLIVGIPRSGMLAATLLSLYLNLPLSDLDAMLRGDLYESGRTKKKDGWISEISQARKILIVEDSSSTGKSLEHFRERTNSFEYKERIIVLTVYVTDQTKELTDIWFENVPGPRMFEWNYLHHSRLDNMCFDIDGVLCVDPTEEENDDGEKYVHFIRNAPVKVAPTFPIGYIITSRLEKYREDTEYWLNKNNIQYGELIMMPFASKEERIRSGSHGAFKGSHYKRLKPTYLFVESNAKQAEEIARVSGKTVFCIENQRVYEESLLVKRQEKAKSLIKQLLPSKVKEMLKHIMNRKAY